MDEAALQEVRETRLCINRLDEWLINQIQPFIGRRVLDVGCGMGNLLSHFIDRELVIGVDTSSASIKYIQENYISHNILTFNYDVTQKDFLNLRQYQIDTIVSFNVLEHIEQDEIALDQIKDIMVAGGKFILVLPAHNFLYGTMDTAIGHLRRYNKRDLTQKLERHGFRIIKQKYVNLFGAFGWFVNGKILQKKVPPVHQLKLFNSLMPIVVAIESRMNMPFGLSILSISTNQV